MTKILKSIYKIITSLSTFVNRLHIKVRIVDLKDQLYPTLGDYYKHGNTMNFLITDVKNPDFHDLIFLHEYIEYILTNKRGITIKEITEYDLEWENRYEQHLNKAEEPGDELDAPYHKEHEFAKKIEKLVCEELGYTWEEYDNYVMNKCK